MQTDKTKEELRTEQTKMPIYNFDFEKEYYKLIAENSILKNTVKAQSELIAVLLK